MLWPVILPFQITCLLLTTGVVLLTVYASVFRWKRWRTFLISALLALLAFIPSCVGIMFLVDGTRFGNFEFATFKDINDPRAKRYLPPTATAIKMNLQASGYRAQYRISDEELRTFVDRLWEKSDGSARKTRQEIHGIDFSEEVKDLFGDLSWEPIGHVVSYQSPTAADGGGAVYYFDPSQGVVYQGTVYW